MKKKLKSAKAAAGKDPTITARDRRYRENMRRTGFTRVHVFVPQPEAQKVRDFARKLREKVATQPG